MPMRRYLIVANQTLGGEALNKKLAEYMAQGPCRFYLVVPATQVSEYEPVPDLPLALSGVDGGAGMIPDADQVARSLARRHLERELARLRELGADADGEVGDPKPLRAIRSVLKRQEVDEVIVSTLPHRMSRWMVMDLPHRVQRTFGLPVTHVSGPAGPLAVEPRPGQRRV
jgi:hypothetical protein